MEENLKTSAKGRTNGVIFEKKGNYRKDLF